MRKSSKCDLIKKLKNNNCGMVYDCTLLKDLPEYAAGTKFLIQEFEHCGKVEYYCRFPEDEENDSMSFPNYRIARKVIDDPKWVRKTLNRGCLTDMRCRVCGGTDLLIMAKKATNDYDDGVVFYKMKMVGICPCGYENEFLTFTTHTKLY
jgi:hypothetical protein